MKKALVIGSNSDIAQCAIGILRNDFEIIEFNRKHGDLSFAETRSKIYNILDSDKPSLVIHSAGVFGGNDLEFLPTFRINVESAWWVIKYYLDHPPMFETKIILLGSSCYSQGRKNYILYAASKAALHSIWQGAKEEISDTVKIGILHPVRVNTKMVSHLKHPNPELCLEAEDVASEIVKLSSMLDHTHIDIGYKEKSNENRNLR